MVHRRGAPARAEATSGVSVRLVGRIGDTLAQRIEQPGVKVLGPVDDLSPELEGADLAVIPLRIGGGTRLKIIEAFATGIPVVSTSVGAEGLGVSSGVQLLIGDRPEELAAACGDVIDDAVVRDRLVRTGHARLRPSLPVVRGLWPGCPTGGRHARTNGGEGPVIGGDRAHRRRVERILSEVIEPTSNCIEVRSAHSSLTAMIDEHAPRGRHLVLPTGDERVDRLDDLIDPDRPVRFIRIDASDNGLRALEGATEMLRRDRPYVLIDRPPGATVDPNVRPDRIHDLLEASGLQLATIRQWFTLGNLARLHRREFVAGFEAGAERAVLAHPPHRLPKDAREAPPPTPGRVSVIVPTLNEEAAIDACLRTIRDQTYARTEILVIDGRSHDRTREIVAEHAAADPRVRLIDNPDRVIPTALNRAIWAASGQWLVRVDAHATIPTDYIERLVEHLGTGRWGGVGGRKDGTSTEPMGRAIAAALGSPFGVGNSVYHHGTTVQVVDHLAYGAYPLDVARSIGGWNERLVANEDYEFDHRVQEAGHELLFDPAIKVRWVSQQRIRGLGRQYRRYGRAKAQVMRISPGSTKLRHLVAPGLVGWTAVAAVIGLRRPRFGIALMAPYALGVAAATAWTARSLPPSVAVRTAPAFVTMHYAWGAGWWERMALQRTAAGATARHRPVGVRPERAGPG